MLLEPILLQQDMEPTLLSCHHMLKVELIGFDGFMNYIAKEYSCTLCGKKFTKIPAEKKVVSAHDSHKQFVVDCFGCKIKTLQFATGDANGSVIASGTTQKKNTAELDAYQSAVKQGIQPNSTRTKDVQKAIDISNKTGIAFDASKS